MLQQKIYQQRLGLGYDVIRGSRVLSLRMRDGERRNIWHRICRAFRQPQPGQRLVA